MNDVIEFLGLLNYKYIGSWDGQELGKIKTYQWFDQTDYRSSSGVLLYIDTDKQNVISVETRTTAGRSYYDLEHQNKTIKLLKKHFGGTFYTDYGKGRYLNLVGKPPEPASLGCHLAFSSFGSNLIRVRRYFDGRTFGNENEKLTGISWIDQYNPELLSNSFVLVFLISIAEDYWKSTFIALLKFSQNKESILKSAKISTERLVLISNGQLSVEQGFAESISFARISVVCNNFKSLDKRLDFAGILKKPYRRRKKNLFDSLEEMTELRNTIIHKASSPILLSREYIVDAVNILHDSIEKCYIELTRINDWNYNKSWGVGRLR